MHKDEERALLPNNPPLSEEDIQRRMGGLEFTVSKDARLHFRLLVPLGWTWRDPNEAKCPPGTLLSLVFGSSSRAEIRVIVDNIPRETSPAEWVLIELERAGHTLVTQSEMDTPIGTLADILTKIDGPDGTMLARTNMAKDGARIFTITCQAREDVYRELAGEFLISLASWKLLAPEKAPLAEPLGTFSELYPAAVGFRYPESWQLASEVLSAEVCDVRLDNLDGDRRTGQIHVQLRAAQRPQKLVSAYLAKLAAAGVELQGRPDLTPCSPRKGFLTAASLVAPAAYKGDPFEVRAHAMEIDGAGLLIAIAGPARSKFPASWAVNKRAFEIVRDSIYAV
jgi:hypothetical protein